MTAHSPGDIVLAPSGQKWRVIAVVRDVVRAEELETGVVSQFTHDALERFEPYPSQEQR